jgi:hypothetical protein
MSGGKRAKSRPSPRDGGDRIAEPAGADAGSQEATEVWRSWSFYLFPPSITRLILSDILDEIAGALSVGAAPVV